AVKETRLLFARLAPLPEALALPGGQIFNRVGPDAQLDQMQRHRVLIVTFGATDLPDHCAALPLRFLTGSLPLLYRIIAFPESNPSSYAGASISLPEGSARCTLSPDARFSPAPAASPWPRSCLARWLKPRSLQAPTRR